MAQIRRMKFRACCAKRLKITRARSTSPRRFGHFGGRRHCSRLRPGKRHGGELIEFKGGVSGIALNLEETRSRVLLASTRTSKRATKSAAPAASCRFRWAKTCSAASSTRWACHRRQGSHRIDGLQLHRALAPGVVDRQPVKEPMQTGIKAIDAMIPSAEASAS